MYWLEKVEIEGLWDSKNIAFSLGDRANFVIGRNGTGKTTIINLIAATLEVNFPMLDAISFRSIVLTFKEINGRKKPSIQVTRSIRRKTGYPRINYRIKEMQSSEGTLYSLDELEEQHAIREMPDRHVNSVLRRKHVSIIKEQVTSISNISWLTIHRGMAKTRRREEKNYESTVEMKVDYLSDDFIRYYSHLSRQYDRETQKFQLGIFLKLLESIYEESVKDELESLVLEKELEALSDIFQFFGLEDNRYKREIDGHYKQTKVSIDKFIQNKGLTFTDLFAIVNTLKIHGLVDEWNQLNQKRESIFAPIETFKTIINEMFIGKEIAVNENNDLEVTIGDRQPLALSCLSSGEKQIFILLAEALLQQSRPWLYIADEPELSLHVSWQEGLVENLLRINPNAQFLFATHSPEIVGAFSDNIIDMEKYFT